jgi:hypothetical protein
MGVVPQDFCDVGMAVDAEQADRGVAQGGHHLGALSLRIWEGSSLSVTSALDPHRPLKLLLTS